MARTGLVQLIALRIFGSNMSLEGSVTAYSKDSGHSGVIWLMKACLKDGNGYGADGSSVQNVHGD